MTSAEYYTQCPECKSGLIHDYNKGESICQGCGYVVMEQTDDYGRESNATDFEEKARTTRASGSTSFALHDFGLRTEIAFGSKDYSGKSINGEMADQMNSIRKWHVRSRIDTPEKRRLSNVLSKITETCACMSLPRIILETAAVLYRSFETKFDAKGKSIACMAAATVYLACKKCSVVRSLEEIVIATGASEQNRTSVKLASKYYRTLVMEMGVFTDENAAKTTSGSAKPKNPVSPMTSAVDQYISKLANMAKIDTKVERLAMDIAHKTNDHMLADGKAPNGLAAAYIYLAAILLDVNILQRDVSGLSGVTEVTIRNRCKDVLSCFKLVITVKQAVLR